MLPEPREQQYTNSVGYHDLDGRPGFKIAITKVDDQWYLYLSHFWHSGWSILDITDPSDPSLVEFVEGPHNTITHDVQVADDLLIASLEPPRSNWGTVDGKQFDPTGAHTEGIYIFSISDPGRPEREGHYKTGNSGTHRNFYPGGDYVYASEQPKDFESRIFTVVDVSDPAAPTKTARWWLPSQSPSVDDGSVKYHHGPPFVQDGRAYLPYGRKGMLVLDVEEEANPEFVNQLELAGLGSWVGAHSAIPIPETELVLVSNEPNLEKSPVDKEGGPWNYAFLVDVSDDAQQGFSGKTPVGPQVISPLPTPAPAPETPYDDYHEQPGRFGPHNFHYSHPNDSCRFVTNQLLFATYFNAGLRIFDISNPVRPIERGYFVPKAPNKRVGSRRPKATAATHYEDVAVDARGYIYCTEPHRGVTILESPLIAEDTE